MTARIDEQTRYYGCRICGIDLRVEAVPERRRHLGVSQTQWQDSDTRKPQPAGHRQRQLLLAPLRLHGSARHDRDNKLDIVQRLRNPVDQGISDAELAFVDPHAHAFGLKTFGNDSGNSLVRVRVADEDSEVSTHFANRPSPGRRRTWAQ